MRKKFLSITIVLLVLLIIVGCGGDGSTGNFRKNKQETKLTVEFSCVNILEKSYQKISQNEGANSKVDYCIKKTSQTKSYGQAGDEVANGSIQDDGFYQKGLISHYTRDNVAQTVIDHVTGLVWQDDEDVKTLSKRWREAKAYCEAKEDGWRLPTIQELNSILEYSKESSINGKFKNVIDRVHWSSTNYANYVIYYADAWIVNFRTGTQNYKNKLSSYHVRCVHTIQ